MCVGKVNSEKMIGPYKAPKVNNMELINENGKVAFREDLLAISTYYLKITLTICAQLYKNFEDSIYYKILFHTTQPAHAVAAFSVILISLLFLSNERKTLESPLWSFIYLFSFATHAGTQLWMTFISGIALYFALPRHHFGAVQKVLFPKYFMFNSILSLITLYVFLRVNGSNLYTKEIAFQAVILASCFLTELVIRLYFTPPLLSLISRKTKIEAEAKVGMEVGQLSPGDLLKCPHYVTINKAFRKVHGIIAMGNIFTMGCTMFHLYYLSQKLCIL